MAQMSQVRDPKSSLLWTWLDSGRTPTSRAVFGLYWT